MTWTEADPSGLVARTAREESMSEFFDELGEQKSAADSPGGDGHVEAV